MRPLHSIVATFGPETEEPDIVPFEVGGVAAGNETRGHRFMAPRPFTVRRFDDYRRNSTRPRSCSTPSGARTSFSPKPSSSPSRKGFELVEDEGLLDEVAGLVEWPVVLMGSFDESFLHIPEEVIRATIRNNQKCFVLRDPRTPSSSTNSSWSPISKRSDGGKEIVAGNERVIRARLSDAKFFYETDLKTRLEDRLPKLEHIVFHEKLGTQAEAHCKRVAAHGALAGAKLRPLSLSARLRRDEVEARARALAKPTWSPKWSASFPSFKA